MRISLGKVVALGAVSAFALVPALTVPAMASSAATPAVQAQANPTLHYGDHGAAVKRLQERLTALHYDPGTIDGKWGNATSPAVWAFQKVNHMAPTSTAGKKTWAALANPVTPRPLVPKGAKNRAEVDIKHQLLYIYKSGRLVLISHISSGSEKRYKQQGHWEVAHTPRGNFHVYRKAKGWETSPLGKLYKANYFTGGYAIHGEPEVPTHPASHGCVRVPMGTSNIVARLLPIGTAVYVRG
ncbi:MAG: Peptidoglycan-binding domain 1 protein [Actinoallomurus sp.]|nr:Peptidoglycan-binding domain 1 protein [Actinoallomurus sp.]